MNTSAITAFESTVHKSNTWVRELMTELQWDDPQRAYHGLRAVLHALRDRLAVAEASDLAAQLPMLLRGVFYEGWQPSKVPKPERTKEEFLEHIFDEFPYDLDVDPEEVVRAVFFVLSCNISDGEIQDVKASLPEKIRELWT